MNHHKEVIQIMTLESRIEKALELEFGNEYIDLENIVRALSMYTGAQIAHNGLSPSDVDALKIIAHNWINNGMKMH